jgi:hypothetical protein
MENSMVKKLKKTASWLILMSFLFCVFVTVKVNSSNYAGTYYVYINDNTRSYFNTSSSLVSAGSGDWMTVSSFTRVNPNGDYSHTFTKLYERSWTVNVNASVPQKAFTGSAGVSESYKVTETNTTTASNIPLNATVKYQERKQYEDYSYSTSITRQVKSGGVWKDQAFQGPYNSTASNKYSAFRVI